MADKVKLFRAVFPDLVITIDQQVAEDEMVGAQTTTRETHRGELFGIAPTNRRVAMSGLTLVRIVDGRLVESWVKNELPGLLKQLRATALPR